MVTCNGHTGSGHHRPWYTDHHTTIRLNYVGLGTLYYTYIEYSKWMGVPLRPAILMVSVLGVFDGIETSIMNCVAASFDMYYV